MEWSRVKELKEIKVQKRNGSKNIDTNSQRKVKEKTQERIEIDKQQK
jgi:hypothetical protein